MEENRKGVAVVKAFLNMVLANIDLEHMIKNGFRKCDLYSLNSEAFAIEYEINTEIKATEFDIAIEIINKIAPRLCERGIDSDIVVEEIYELKQVKKDRSIEILSNSDNRIIFCRT